VKKAQYNSGLEAKLLSGWGQAIEDRLQTNQTICPYEGQVCLRKAKQTSYQTGQLDSFRR